MSSRTAAVLAISAIAIAVAIVTSGCAVTKTDYSRSGFYVGASMAGSISDFDDADGADLDESDLTAGVGIRGGYRFLDQFALEASYEVYDDFEFDTEDVSIQTFHFSGRFHPLTGRVQPYALAGVGIFDTEVDGTVDIDESEPFVRLGVGVEAYANRHFPIFVEVDRTMPTGDADDLPYWTMQIGALYRF